MLLLCKKGAYSPCIAFNSLRIVSLDTEIESIGGLFWVLAASILVYFRFTPVTAHALPSICHAFLLSQYGRVWHGLRRPKVYPMPTGGLPVIPAVAVGMGKS